MLLNENPFYVLGASTRDDRQRIVELAEEKTLYLDPAQCAQYKADLINPRQRLQSEVAWIPGVSPSRAATAADAALKGALISALPSALAHVNVLLTSVANRKAGSAVDLGKQLLEVAEAWEQVDPERV